MFGAPTRRFLTERLFTKRFLTERFLTKCLLPENIFLITVS